MPSNDLLVRFGGNPAGQSTVRGVGADAAVGGVSGRIIVNPLGVSCQATVGFPSISIVASGGLYPLLAAMPVSGQEEIFNTFWNGPLPVPNSTLVTAPGGGLVTGGLTRFNYTGNTTLPDASVYITTDSSSPVDAPYVMDYVYDIGQPAGQCPEGLWMYPPATRTGAMYRRLYVCDITKIVGSSYQVSGSAMTKHWGYLGMNGMTTAFIMAVFHWNGSYATPASPLAIDMGCQYGPLNATWRASGTGAGGTGPAVFKPGNWGRTEWLCEMNDVGVANGRIRCQFTDMTAGSPPQIVIDSNNIIIRDASHPGGFTAQRDMVPVFGGGGTPKTEQDITRWAHTRIVGQGLNG